MPYPSGFVCRSWPCCLAVRGRPPQVAPSEAVTIPVSKPVVREVTDFVDFTGRTDAIQSVDIRPRITGYLVKMPFEEGAEVKAGSALRDRSATLSGPARSGRSGQVNLYQAQLKLAQTTMARDRHQQHDPQLHQPAADSTRTRPRSRRPMRGSRRIEKDRGVYRLNHEFCNVASPISGMVSRYYLTLGNLVNQDQTLLTTIVSLDPMYAYFDMDEPTLLRIRKAINEGKMKARASQRPARFPCSWAAERGRLSSRGNHQLREQPAQSDHRQHPGARRLCQSQASRAVSGCCRPGCSCESACRSASPIRPCW